MSQAPQEEWFSLASEARTWSAGDTTYLGVALLYGAINVSIMLLAARGQIAGVSLDTIGSFGLMALLGMVLAFPVQIVLKELGVPITWRGGLAVLVCFSALLCFNLWCAISASAAV